MDFGSWMSEGNSQLERFRTLDRYFIIYPGSHFADTNFLINFNFVRAAESDPRFSGFLSDWPERRPMGCYSVNSIDFLRKIKRGEKIGVVSFATTTTELFFEKHLSKHSFSFLTLLADRNEVHTYEKVSNEREYVIQNKDRYTELLQDFLTDDRSRRTLENRISAILALDHRQMIRSLSPISYEYFNNLTPEHSFVLRETERFVDVGASYGDNVLKFAEQISDLAGSRIHAFEPNQMEFHRLNSLRHYLPLVAHDKIVGASSGQKFYQTDSGNVHGSRISEDGVRTDVVALDDMVDMATLVKIDAEGAEPDILKGASRLLSDPRCRAAICAYHYPSDLFSIRDIMAGYGRRRAFFRQHHASLWDAVLYFSD